MLIPKISSLPHRRGGSAWKFWDYRTGSAALREFDDSVEVGEEIFVVGVGVQP